MENQKEIKEFAVNTTSLAVEIIESLYDVKLNEEQIRELAYNIGKKIV